ncbi:putative pyridoxal-phosphate dependent enzyme [Sarocladium strictum]
MSEPSLCAPLEPASILKAHAKIAPYLVRTPLLTSPTIDKIVSHENPRLLLSRDQEGNGDSVVTTVVRYSPKIKLYFKCENLQRTGAFKARGAFHALCNLIDTIGIEALKEKGVATVSSGNHAQGLALAASTMGAPAIIVMPSASASSKIKGAMSHLGIARLNDEGGESQKGRIVFCGPSNAEKKAAAAGAVETTGAVFIPPYDHPDIILGQGTCAMEMQQQFEAMHEEGRLDAVLAPIGGGGLLGGIATWFSDKKTLVFGAEPSFQGADDAARGLRVRERIAEVSSSTIADGLRTPVGLLNWEIVSDPKKVKGIFAASEEEIKLAMRLLIEELKVLVEPSACVPLAVVLFNEEFRRFVAEQQGDESWTLAIVLSGGNTTVGAINSLFGGSE